MRRYDFAFLVCLVAVLVGGCFSKDKVVHNNSQNSVGTSQVAKDDGGDDKNGGDDKEDSDLFIMRVEVLDVPGRDVPVQIFKHPDSQIPNRFSIDCDSDGKWEVRDETAAEASEGNPYIYRCQYQETGEYTIRIKGHVDRLGLMCGEPNAGDVTYHFHALSIDQWGTNQWQSMEDFSSFCTKMHINAKDSPDLSQCRSLRGMFLGAESLNEPLETWDVSNITNMRGMFEDVKAFNQPLEKWDVSNVTDMRLMFYGAKTFNQPLEKWDVSNVTDMDDMFFSAKSFNQPLEKWNVSNVTNMSGMFMGASAFNQPLEKWNVSNVTNMSGMFEEAKSFDQPLEKWDISNVTNMSEMFEGADSFAQSLSAWRSNPNFEREDDFRDCSEAADDEDEPMPYDP